MKDCGWAIPQTETHDLDYDDPEAGAVYRAVRIIAKHVLPGARVEQIAVAVPQPIVFDRHADGTTTPDWHTARPSIRDVHRVTIPRTVPDISSTDERRVDLGGTEPDLDARAHRLRDWFRGGFADGGLSGH